jgi:hypothetical protein
MSKMRGDGAKKYEECEINPKSLSTAIDIPIEAVVSNTSVKIT